MDAATWGRIEAICAEALERPRPERDAFVDRACAGNAELAQEVRSLLRSHDADPAFLEDPIARLGGDGSKPEGRNPTTVGPWRIVRSLGVGGMGEVYLVRRTADGFEQEAALKLIRRGLDSPEVTARFRQERRILARLKHPGIASLLDGGSTDDGVPWVAMEYVDGIRLDRYCDREGLDVPARLRLMLEVCDAVQHAHASLVVHRDLKPGNVLVDPDGRPRLLDFGIGKLLDPMDTVVPLTRTGLRLLTPEYAAPEQLRGEPVTTASDVFSLGVIFYELLTGVHPWAEAGSDPFSREAAIRTGAPRRPSDAAATARGGPGDAPTFDPARRRRTLAGDLDVILLEALRHEPERRYASVEALAEDVRRFLAGLPVRARPDTLSYRVGKFVRRNTAAVAAAGLATAVLLGATVVVAAQNTRIRAESERVAAERDKALSTQGILLEMFGAVGPDQTEGGEVTARALLDAQAARLDAYDGQPELQAQLQYVLADGYQRLGLMDDAAPLAEAALATRREILAPGHPDRGHALNLLGWIRKEQGDADEGERLLRAAAELWREAGPEGALPLSRALNDLGVLLTDRRELDEALSFLQEALAIRLADLGPRHRAVGITANNVAAALWSSNRAAEAAEHAQIAVDALEASLGPDHGRVWIARSNLMVMVARSATPDSTIAARRAHVQRAEEVFGPDHRETIWGVSQLATTLHQAGGSDRIDEALDLHARAVAGARGAYGPDHPNTAAILAGWAAALAAARRYAESIAVREQAREAYAAAYGPDNAQVGLQIRELARTWFAAGDDTRGDAWLEASYDHLRRSLGPTHPVTLSERVSLGRRMLNRGEVEAGVAWARSLVAVIDSLPAPHPQVAAEARLTLAQGLLDSGREAEADSLLAAVRDEIEGLPAGTRAFLAQVEGRGKVTEGAPPGGE